MPVFKASLAFAVLSFIPILSAGGRQAVSPSDAPLSIQVVEVTANKYTFTPSEIHLRKGSQVQFTLHCVDKEHGVKFNIYPEGSKTKGAPGLQFNGKLETGKVKKGDDATLNFLAVQPGTYDFKCSVFCGLGHHRMKGKLIVE
jgi:cytochrome c oxidase subunit II